METISLALSMLSLVVAGGAAYFTYSLSRHQLRLASRHEFQKLLLEVNKELLRDPELWGAYDSHPMAKIKRDDPHHKAKLEAFTYMFLNVFQIVCAYSEDPRNRDPGDSTFYAAWQGTCKDFLNDSCLAREVLLRPDSELVYDARFLAVAKSLMKS